MEKNQNNCKSILIVEDERDIRETLQEALELEGYVVYSAANGRDAIERLDTIPRPCLILLDLMMPVMTGWQFLEVQKRDARIAPIPVVIVTAAAGKVASEDIAGLLRKPIAMEVLLKVVEQYCGMPS